MGCQWLYLVTLATLLELFLGLSLFRQKHVYGSIALEEREPWQDWQGRRDARGEEGRDGRNGRGRDGRNGQREEWRDWRDEWRGIDTSRWQGEFFLQTWRPAPVCVHLQVDPLWIVILPVSQIQHVTWLTQDGIEIAS